MVGIKSILCVYVLNVQTPESILASFVLCFPLVWESLQKCTRFKNPPFCIVSFSCFAQKRIQRLLWKDKFPWFPYTIGSCLSGSTYHFTDSCSWHAEEEQKWDGLRQAGGVLKIRMDHRTNINKYITNISDMCLSIALSAVQYFLYSGYISNLGWCIGNRYFITILYNYSFMVSIVKYQAYFLLLGML